ncbi:hypothetical protein APSETT444_007289 [Aspergillus pseudonomiae]
MFQVSFEPEVDGNCAGHKNDFSQIIEDAYILSKAGIQAVSDSTDKDSKTRSEADRLVRAIFQDPSDEERGRIARRLKLVRNFFEKEGKILHGASKRKPYLFCSDSWRTREDMSSQMKDEKGNLMKDKNGSSYLIKDDKQMKSRQKAAMRELGVSKTKYVFPYWCGGLNAYMFDKSFGSDSTLGPCSSGEKILGYTVWESKEDIGAVVLCNEAFVGGRLRSVTVDPFGDSVFAKGNKPPQKKTTIKMVSPMATTFYHELFHLLFATLMDPENGEEYQFKRMTGKAERVGTKGTQETFSKEQAIMNPHSYVYTSIACDYTQNERYSGQDSGETYPIEFYTGWATYNA